MKSILPLSIFSCVIVSGCSLWQSPPSVPNNPTSSASSSASQVDCLVETSVNTEQNAACVLANGQWRANTATGQLLGVLDSPLPNAVVTSPFAIAGEVRGTWMFEASFSYRIENTNGDILSNGVLTAEDDWMTEELVPFSGTGTFPSNGYANLLLVLEKSNASGLPEHSQDAVFPITVAAQTITNNQQLITAYIQENIQRLSPITATNSGVFIVTETQWNSNSQAKVRYEDGHYQYEILVDARVTSDGEITIENIQFSDDVLIENQFDNKIVYTQRSVTAEAMESFRNDCASRGGEFNECGSPCPDSAEACVQVCALVCRLQTESGISARYEQYQNNEVGLQLQHPANFTIQEDIAAPVEASFNIQFTGPTQSRNTEFFDGISMIFLRINTDQTVDEFVQEQIEETQNIGKVLEEPSSTTIAGQAAVQYTVQTLGEHTHYILVDGDDIIHISASSPDPNNYGYSEMVEYILNSIQFAS